MFANCDPKRPVSAKGSNTMYTYSTNIRILLKPVSIEITIKPTNYMHAYKIYDFTGMLLKYFITCQQKDKSYN